MKGFSNFTTAPFFILLCTCHASPSNMNKDAALIDKACKATKDYDLCLSILRGDPRNAISDIESLTIITLEYTVSKAEDTIELLNKLATDTTDSLLKVCFKGCVEEYGMFVEYCSSSISDGKNKSYQDVQDNINYAA